MVQGTRFRQSYETEPCGWSMSIEGAPLGGGSSPKSWIARHAGKMPQDGFQPVEAVPWPSWG